MIERRRRTPRVTSKSSRIAARTATDAAAETASSNSSPSAYAERRRRRAARWRGCGGSRGTAARAGCPALRRRAPVDVPQVVAGDVLAQRVEGEVAGWPAGRWARLRGRCTMPGSSDGSGTTPRPHVGAPPPRPSARPAPEQPERVGADVGDGPDVDAPRGACGTLDRRVRARRPAVHDRQPHDLARPATWAATTGRQQRHPARRRLDRRRPPARPR